MDEIKRQLAASDGTKVEIYNIDLSNIVEEVFDELQKYKYTLKEFRLTRCHLVYIPESIGNLSNLTHFYCHGNQLKNLPESIGNLTNLTRFSCSNNQLEYLQESIGNLTNLTHFYCDNNQLENLPESIGNLTNLTLLWCDNRCDNNQLKYLPISMRFLDKLKYFICDIDEIQNLDKVVYEKGASAVIEWMQENYSPMVKSTNKN